MEQKKGTYTKETALKIKELLDKGMTPSQIYKDPALPSERTINKWIADNRWGVFSDEPEVAVKKEGRSTLYTEELAEEILTRIMQNEGLRSISKDPHMPSLSTILKWVAENKEGFGDDYNIAFRTRLMFAAEEILDISDDGTNDYVEKQTKNGEVIVLDSEHISRSKLRVDTRKWLLSKLVNQYKEKQAIDVTSSDGSMSPSGAPTSFEINFIEGKAPDANED